MVGYVELVVLYVIIGTPVVVFAFAIFMVPTSIFEAASVNGGCDGCSIADGVIVA